VKDYNERNISGGGGPVEIYTMTRPSTLPMPACASAVLLPAVPAASVAVTAASPASVAVQGAGAFIGVEAAVTAPEQTAPVAVLAAERAPVAAPAHREVSLAGKLAPISGAHQVQLQAELTLVRGRFDGTDGITSTTAFKGNDVSMKRYADGGSGVPPRGRPV
jgi:hypothetical protein